jgi:predicted metal-binding membrane protein
MMHADRTLLTAHTRDRAILAACIALLAAAGWGWLVYQDWAMSHMDVVDMAMPGVGPWNAGDVGLVFVMWAIMMVAMMLPAVAPVALLYRRVVGARDTSAPPLLMTALFLAGYVAVWTAFSALATLAQWALHEAGLLSPAMQTRNAALGGAVLIGAGVYQFTVAKRACLRHCRSPFAFLLNAWRSGKRGAGEMGLRHGLYCTGCCWLLMMLLFVVGVMNLAWIAAITALVVAEKLLPGAERIARIAGVGLIAWGAWLAGTALLR